RLLCPNRCSAMTQITAILNVHREGILAHASLLSIAAARQTAATAGIAVEVIAVADCSDRLTLDTLAADAGVQVLETSVDDLGLARNVGVAAARGQYIAFLDGDDLWGRCWLRAAYEAATTESRPTVWHPEASLYFGSKHEPHWLIHPDIETIEGDWVSLGLRNQWTSLSFASRTTYLEVPYRRTNLAQGCGARIPSQARSGNGAPDPGADRLSGASYELRRSAYDAIQSVL